MTPDNPIAVGTCEKGCHVLVTFRDGTKRACAFLDEERAQDLIDALTGQLAEVKAKVAIVEGSA